MSQDIILNERARFLFKHIVRRYISDGQPVGSRTLSKESEISLSAATIRNVMADLEDVGLLISPHTSAGRIPSVKGYRFFVEQLLEVKPLSNNLLHTLQHELNDPNYSDNVLAIASAQLAEITGMAGIVMLPMQEQKTMRQIEFLPLSDKQVLVILVTNDRDVQNRIISTSRNFTQSELTEASNYLNHHFGGRNLLDVRQQLLQAMQETRSNMDNLMRNVIEVANQAFDNNKQQHDYLLSGQTKLMNYSEMGNIQRFQQLFDAFNQKRDLLHLLDQSLHAQGIQIFIGEESGYQFLDECSLVTAPYSINKTSVGVLGVIGPTRMDYDKVIPIVDVTALLLSSALSQQRQ